MNSSSPASFWPPETMPNSDGLLDGVGGVAAGVRHADDLGLGSLRLQQERGEVRRIQGMPDGADNLAARFHHDRGGVAFQRVAERVVRGQEVPGVAAGLHQRLPGAVREHVGVIDPVNCVRRALGIGEVRRRRAGIDHDGVLFLHQIVDRQRNAGVQHIHEDIDLLDVDPLTRDGGGDVGLVLVVGGDDVDLPALAREARNPRPPSARPAWSRRRRGRSKARNCR